MLTGLQEAVGVLAQAQSVNMTGAASDAFSRRTSSFLGSSEQTQKGQAQNSGKGQSSVIIYTSRTHSQLTQVSSVTMNWFCLVLSANSCFSLNYKFRLSNS
jgi:hypothetical protein